MEPNIPTSFIPKRPVTSTSMPVRSGNHAVGLLSAITVIAVIATGVSFAGVYLYQKRLASVKVKNEKSIDEAKNGLGTEFVQEMKRLNARVEGVKLLIKNHIVVSPIFAALEQTTLRAVQYKTFGYEMKTDPGTKTAMVHVTLNGTAKSYATIALQSDAFIQSPLIKNPVFSGLSIEDKSNVVNFKLAFDVNPADLSYQKFIDNQTVNAQPVTVTPKPL